MRGYADHREDHVRRQFKEVPLYLRDLINQVVAGYVPHPGTISEMLSQALNGDTPRDVAVITLNYDDYVERALESFQDPIRDVRAYVQTGRPVKLFKLRGSVTWGVEVGEAGGDWRRCVADVDLDWVREAIPVVSSHADKRSWEWTGPNNRLLYPRLTAIRHISERPIGRLVITEPLVADAAARAVARERAQLMARPTGMMR